MTRRRSFVFLLLRHGFLFAVVRVFRCFSGGVPGEHPQESARARGRRVPASSGTTGRRFRRTRGRFRGATGESTQELIEGRQKGSESLGVPAFALASVVVGDQCRRLLEVIPPGQPTRASGRIGGTVRVADPALLGDIELARSASNRFSRNRHWRTWEEPEWNDPLKGNHQNGKHRSGTTGSGTTNHTNLTNQIRRIGF